MPDRSLGFFDRSSLLSNSTFYINICSCPKWNASSPQINVIQASSCSSYRSHPENQGPEDELTDRTNTSESKRTQNEKHDCSFTDHMLQLAAAAAGRSQVKSLESVRCGVIMVSA